MNFKNWLSKRQNLQKIEFQKGEFFNGFYIAKKRKKLLAKLHKITLVKMYNSKNSWNQIIYQLTFSFVKLEGGFVVDSDVVLSVTFKLDDSVVTLTIGSVTVSSVLLDFDVISEKISKNSSIWRELCQLSWIISHFTENQNFANFEFFSSNWSRI